MIPDFPLQTVRSRVPYSEVLEPKEIHGGQGDSIIRVVDTAWSTRRLFLADMMGFTSDVINPTRVPFNINGVDVNLELPGRAGLFRFTPEVASPTWDYLYCTDASLIQGFGNHTVTGRGESVYDVARYQLTYTSPPYDIAPDDPLGKAELYRYVERIKGLSVESLTGGAPGQFRFVTNGDVVPEGVPIVMPSQSLKIVWHQIPQIHLRAIERTAIQCAGTVNSVPFDVDDVWTDGGVVGFPRGTVLFLGMEREPKGRMNRVYPNASESASIAYTVTFSFLVRNNGPIADGVVRGNEADTHAGWNYLLKPSTGKFHYCTAAGPNGAAGAAAGRAAYQHSDLSFLFLV